MSTADQIRLPSVKWGFNEINEEWRDDAACRTHRDPDLWFPDVDTLYRVPMAKRICGQCPVREQCLKWALDNEEQYGIWGGMTPQERHQISRLSRRKRMKKSDDF